MPLLLLGFRDEFTGRPWQPPARHWPGSPLIGGRDEQAGGTWLAVHPHVPRVACLLNGRGPQAPPDTRRSRGDLPLRAAGEGSVALEHLHDDHATLAHYDPFFLICADLTPATHALMLSWDGEHAALEPLGPATHVITNAGHTFPSADQDAKAAHFGLKFATHRPDADPAATIKDAWGDWLTLAGGDGLSDTDPAAIVVRHELPDGRVYGTTSVSLVALGADGLRYDFQPVPADPTTWYSVDLDARTELEELEVLPHLPVTYLTYIRGQTARGLRRHGSLRLLVPPELGPLHHHQVIDQRRAERRPVELVRIKRRHRLAERGRQPGRLGRVRIGRHRRRRLETPPDAVKPGRDVRRQVQVRVRGRLAEPHLHVAAEVAG